MFTKLTKLCRWKSHLHKNPLLKLTEVFVLNVWGELLFVSFQRNPFLCLENRCGYSVSHSLQCTSEKVKQGIAIWSAWKQHSTHRDIWTAEQTHTQSEIIHKAKLFESHNTALTSVQRVDHLFSQTVCVCVCVSMLAKFVPLSGGPLHVSGLQRAASHSESILFDCRSLDLHVKQLLMLETEGKGG